MKKQNSKTTRLLTVLLFVFILIFSGCEKKPLINEQHLETIPQEEYAIQKDKALTPIVLDWDEAMKELSFQNLLSETGELNSNELILKGANKKKVIKLNKTKVKKIKIGDYESYTMLANGFDFENLSITNFVLEKKKGKSNAYFFTYFPTKGWISNYTNGIFTDFEGKITVDKINLDEYQLKSALVCETYFVLIEHECTAGANHTVDEIDDCNGSHSQLPYADLIEITHCKLTGDSGGATYDSSTDTGSGSSPSGGGSTTTGEGSTPSDEGSTDAEPIIEPTTSPFLNPLNYSISFYETISSRLELSNAEQQLLVNLGRDPFLDELYLFLDINKSLEATQLGKEILSFYNENNWKSILKQAVANSITSTAEVTHQIYKKLSDLAQRYPSSINYINTVVDEFRGIAGEAFDTNPQTLEWFDLFGVWLFELGTYPKESGIETITFDGDDKTTESLKQQEGVNEARDIAVNKIQNNDIAEPVIKGWTYGQGEFYDGVQNGNIATSFLGSYTTRISISQNSDGTYMLTYIVTNLSTWESATRLRIDNDGDGTHDGIFPNKEKGKGIHIGGTINQTWTWIETL